MPLTPFQAMLARTLAANRSEDSYLAGGSAIHLEPNSIRFSNDLDYFHDSEQRVASAFNADRVTLLAEHYKLQVEMNQPGYIRAIVSKDNDSTKVEWAHDSSWRFLPTIQDPEVGFRMHPTDLAVNKVLALAGRDEARDYIDILDINQRILPLGALCWAAVGKDPGFTPLSLLDLLKRRGRYHKADFERLNLRSGEIDLIAMKTTWLNALELAEQFIRSAPPAEAGCLYYSRARQCFIQPNFSATETAEPHFGRPGGVLPMVRPNY